MDEHAIEKDRGDRRAGLFDAKLALDDSGNHTIEESKVDFDERLGGKVGTEGALGGGPVEQRAKGVGELLIGLA
jgi:hypothetical protein